MPEKKVSDRRVPLILNNDIHKTKKINIIDKFIAKKKIELGYTSGVGLLDGLN